MAQLRHWCALGYIGSGGIEFNMRKLSTFFEPSKRMKAAVVEEGTDGSSFSFRRLTDAELEPELSRKGKEVSEVENAGVVEERGEASLNKEQKQRMELNHSIACAKRNLRLCEQAVQAAQGSFPDLKDLLVEPTWRSVLEEEFEKQYMEQLNAFVKKEAAGTVPIYPPAAKVFNAFNSCPFERVKVVLLGQDPYHGPGQAMGLSFSVPQGVPIPSSLLNIYKELHADLGCRIPSHGNLEKWAHQGVLLLNAALTVRARQANSHSKKGWEHFTTAAIRVISQRRKGIVFLLWGNYAQEKTKLIDTSVHHVLKAAHPSGLSAHKGFFNCRHFSKTNKLLEDAGLLPVDWQL